MPSINLLTSNRENIKEKIQEVWDKGGRLVAINGYVDTEGNNVVVYTVEYDNTRERITVYGEEEIPTITSIYKGAQWFEEEIQEMMPIKFEGLQASGRLFLPEEFEIGDGQILIMPLEELRKLKNN